MVASGPQGEGTAGYADAGIDLDADTAVDRWPSAPDPGTSEAVAASRLRAHLFGTPEVLLADRYRLVERVGAGAMGEVWRAHDARLDRDVAIKLLRSGTGGAAAVARLAHEARSLARLSHPNVVEVFDVGEIAGTLGRSSGQLFVAMAYVEGQTLRAWARMPERTWQQRLDALVWAGEGVAAAHGVGLIHRDFKPENVLVDRSGRVFVADFGLARRTRGAPPVATADADADALRNEPAETLGGSLTASGKIVGTPIYMAPEQLAGGEANVGTDVYAWCATAYEVLFGVLPFTGTFEAVQVKKRNVELTTPSDGRGVPTALRDLLVRGLAAQPSARFATMAEALAAVRRTRRSPRWRWLGIVGAPAAVAASLLIPRSTEADCERRAWDRREWSARRDATHREAAVLGPAAERVVAQIDRRADEISAGISEACRVTPQAEDALVCWRRAAAELDAVAGRLARGDLGLEGWAALRRPLASEQGCDRAAEGTRPPIDVAPRVEAQHAALLDAKIARWTGDPTDALAQVDDVLADATGSDGWPPLAAYARFERASTLRELGDVQGAIADYRSAYFEALEADALETAVIAAVELAMTLAGIGDAEGAATWLRYVRMLADRTSLSPRRQARVLAAEAGLAIDRRDYPTARAILARGAELCDAADCGPLDSGLPSLRMRLACALEQEECVALARESATAAQDEYGADARQSLAAAVWLVQATSHLGHDADAVDLAEALDVRLAELATPAARQARESLRVLHVNALLGLGRCAEARVVLSGFGVAAADDVERISRHARADVATCLGDPEAALTALAGTEDEAGPDDHRATSWYRRAVALLRLGRIELAARALERAEAFAITVPRSASMRARYEFLHAALAEASGAADTAEARGALARFYAADACGPRIPVLWSYFTLSCRTAEDPAFASGPIEWTAEGW